MKKIFFTIAVLFNVIFNTFGQELENIKMNFNVKGTKFDTVISVSPIEPTEVFIAKNVHLNASYVLQESARDVLVTQTLLVEPINSAEVLHNLNYGINKFAKLEIASLSVGVGGTAIGLLLPSIAKNTGVNVYNCSIAGYTIIGASCVTAAILQICAILQLKNNSLDNFYISEHGIGFKIDIK